MILAFLGVKSLAISLAASSPTLSLSKFITTESKDSRYSRLFLTSATPPCAPDLIETTGHLEPISS